MTAGFALRVVAVVLCGAALPAAAIDVDGIAAKVGPDNILRSDVIAEMRRMGQEDGAHYAEVLEEMVERRLILQAAAESKMTLQDWVVDNRIREIVQKGFGGDRNKLIEMLGERKISYPEWRAKVKEDMVVSAMRWNVVDKNIAASPTAMRREYDEHRERYSQGRKVSISAIMLDPGETARKETISAQLKEKSFQELGGTDYDDINPVDLFKPELVREIDELPVGSVSRWIEIDGWSYLFRKKSEVAGRSLPFDEAYEEIEAAVKEAEQKRLYDEWIGRLRSETYIKVF